MSKKMVDMVSVTYEVGQRIQMVKQGVGPQFNPGYVRGIHIYEEGFISLVVDDGLGGDEAVIDIPLTYPEE